MLSQRSPILPPIPYPPTPPFWPWHSPVLGHIKFASTMGLSFHWWPTRPSFDTYAAKDKSSRVLVGSYCCSTYRVAVPFSSLGNFSSSSIGGHVIHPIADCDHPLLCLLGPGIVSQETVPCPWEWREHHWNGMCLPIKLLIYKKTHSLYFLVLLPNHKTANLSSWRPDSPSCSMQTWGASFLPCVTHQELRVQYAMLRTFHLLKEHLKGLLTLVSYTSRNRVFYFIGGREEWWTKEPCGYTCRMLTRQTMVHTQVSSFRFSSCRCPTDIISEFPQDPKMHIMWTCWLVCILCLFPGLHFHQ
jgi:hypothetical protein